MPTPTERRGGSREVIARALSVPFRAVRRADLRGSPSAAAAPLCAHRDSRRVEVEIPLLGVRLQWNDLGTSARKTTKPENRRLVGQPQGGRFVRTRNPE
jgi:hypothetical protein